jgi:hypothetical protein
MKRLLLLLGACMGGCLVGADVVPGYFTQLDFDGGGYVTGFAAHRNGRLYCRANVGGLYRSDDHGETWTWLSGDMTTPAGHLPWGLAVAPGDPDIVYQSTGTSYTPDDPACGVWKSSDGGRHWRQVLGGVGMAANDDVMYGGPALLLHPQDENEVWVATRGAGLVRSRDAGGHWDRVGGTTLAGFTAAALCIHPRFPDQVWAVGDGGVFVSVNHGDTWTRLRACTRAYRVVRFEDGGTLVVGQEQGAGFLWSITATDWNDPATYRIDDRSAAFADTPGEITLLSIVGDGRTVWAGTHMVTKLSRDRGVTWQRAAMLVDRNGYWPVWQARGDTTVLWGRSEIVQDPAEASRWFLASGNNPYVSTDAGTTWRNLPRGLAEVCVGKPVFHPLRPDVVFVPMADLYAAVVTDGGRSGFAERCLYATMPEHIASYGTKVLVDGETAILLYKRFGERGARLAVTRGDYAQWEEFTPDGIPLDLFCDGAMSPDDRDDFLVLTAGTTGPGAAGVYRTTDGGHHFVQSTGLPDGAFTGGNFSYFGYDVLHPDPVDLRRRYLWLMHRGFFRSDDRGANWRQLTSPLDGQAGAVAPDPARTGRLWAAVVTGGSGQPAAGRGLLRTDDGGVTWSVVADFSFRDPRVDARAGQVAVFGRRSGDSWDRIYLSTDDGATWGEVTREGYRFPTVNGLAFDPHHLNRLWIGTSGRSAAVFSRTSDPRARDLSITAANWEGRRGDSTWLPDVNGSAGTLVRATGGWTALRTRGAFDPGTAVTWAFQPLLAAGIDGAARARIGFGDGWPDSGRFCGVEVARGEVRLVDSASPNATRVLGRWQPGEWITCSLAVTPGGRLRVGLAGAPEIAVTLAPPLGGSFRLVAGAADTAEGMMIRTPQTATVVAEEGPAITRQPGDFTLRADASVTLEVVAAGAAPLSYQWYAGQRGDTSQPLPGAAGMRLVTRATAGTATYWVRVSDANGATDSEAATITGHGGTATARLVNVSFRCAAGVGDRTPIGGFVIAGGSERVLLRGIGPGLRRLGVAAPLADPVLKLFGPGGVPLGTSDDWAEEPDLTALFGLVGAFPLDPGSADSATLRVLDPGAYTVHLEGKVAAGVGLFENYEVGTAPDGARIVNLSARAPVAGGEDVAVMGFVVGGTGTETLLARGIGPSLAGSGVGGFIANPRLTLYDRQGRMLGQNDDWGGDATVHGAIRATGATEIARETKDAAMLIGLRPGAYTLQVDGVGGTTGVALLELFEVP